MVGRGGRSRGCKTCRRKKIKCDEARPSCNKCKASKVECEGYPDLSFINYSGLQGNEARKGVVSSARRPITKNDSPLESVIGFGDPAKATNPLDQEIDLTPVRALSQSPLDENLLFSHLDSVFSAFRSLPDQGQTRVRWSGLYVIGQPQWHARNCLLAFASVLFGKKQGVQEALLHGEKLYGQALRTLNERLSGNAIITNDDGSSRGSKADAARLQLDDDALFSAMILGTYEFLAATSIGGWINHYRGLGLMMKLRGPQAHVHPVSRQLLEANRMMVALAALADRKSTFLAQPAWKTIPWTGYTKDRHQRLLDGIVDIPGLLEQLDLLDSSDEEARDQLYNNAMDVLDGLLAWRASWNSVPGGNAADVPNPSSDSGQVALFPTILAYPSLEAANCVCIFDAGTILCYEVLTQTAPAMLHKEPLDNINTQMPSEISVAAASPASVASAITSSSGSSNGSAIPSLSSTQSSSSSSSTASEVSPALCEGFFGEDARAAAIEICRSIPYQLKSDKGMAGALFVLWPLRLAWLALGGSTSAMGRWLEQILRGLASHSGKSWGVGKATLLNHSPS